MQQCLHVPAAIDDQQNIEVVFDNAVNDAIRFEKDLAVLANAQGQKFFRISPALRGIAQAGEGGFDPGQNIIRFFRKIVPGEI